MSNNIGHFLDANVWQFGEYKQLIYLGNGAEQSLTNKQILDHARALATGLRARGFKKGDIGKIDDDGELYVTGRRKDIIIKGGENIDPGIAENWLYQHPAVMECAVIAMKDEKYGEEVAAVIVLKAGCSVTEEELLLYTSQHIHPFTAPKKIFFALVAENRHRQDPEKRDKAYY